MSSSMQIIRSMAVPVVRRMSRTPYTGVLRLGPRCWEGGRKLGGWRPQAQRRNAAPAAAAAAPSASAGAVAESDDGSVHAVVPVYAPTSAHEMPRHGYVDSIAALTAAKPPAIGVVAEISMFDLIVAAACVKNAASSHAR